MNHCSIARKFLEWFEQEDEGKASEVWYAPGTDFLLRYRDAQTGRLHNVMGYVVSVAHERLVAREAGRVAEEAVKLLQPTH